MSSATGAVLGLLVGCGLVLTVLGLSTPRRPSIRRVGRTEILLKRAGLPHARTSGVVAVASGLFLVAGALTLVITAVPMAAVIAACVAATVPAVQLHRRATRRQRALRASWPEAVDSLASGVRAGLSLPEAVAELSRHGPAPLRREFAEFGIDYHATGSFEGALTGLQGRLADPVADRVIASLRIAREVGGTDLGVVLRTLSSLLREDGRTRGEIEARQSWTVAAARLAVAAPWITLALLCTRPDAVRAYASGTGALVLAIAAVLSVVAYRLMLRIGRLPEEARVVT